jgi:hypothetical protein
MCLEAMSAQPVWGPELEMEFYPEEPPPDRAAWRCGALQFCG